jgi:hypothetical protein
MAVVAAAAEGDVYIILHVRTVCIMYCYVTSNLKHCIVSLSISAWGSTPRNKPNSHVSSTGSNLSPELFVYASVSTPFVSAFKNKYSV